MSEKTRREELENRKDKDNILKTENISKKYLKKNEKPENINISLVTLKNNFIIGWSFL